MNNLFGFPFEQLPFLIIVIVMAFSLHEFAHAYFADRFGDPTPRSMGRVTLNPRSHLDILGILMIILVGFGWARPVMVRSSFFKKQKLMSIIVSVAGPLSNLLLAFIGVVAAFLLSQFHAYDGMSVGLFKAVAIFLQLHIMLNLMLFIFNLLPLPPLDGYRILYEFFPYNWRVKMQTLEQYAFLIFLLLVVIDPLYKVTLGPVLDLRWDILSGMNDICSAIFGKRGQLFEIGIPVI
jgi:Zn-dependent protease